VVEVRELHLRKHEVSLRRESDEAAGCVVARDEV